MNGLISFYCQSCKSDQDLPASRHETSLAKWFQAYCPTCQKKLIRYIDDKSDPYFYESRKLKEQRARYAKDVIQYGEAGFQTFYREAWEGFEAQKEAWEKAQYEKKKERDEFYKNNRLNNKELAKKVLDIEEKLEYGGRK